MTHTPNKNIHTQQHKHTTQTHTTTRTHTTTKTDQQRLQPTHRPTTASNTTRPTIARRQQPTPRDNNSQHRATTTANGINFFWIQKPFGECNFFWRLHRGSTEAPQKHHIKTQNKRKHTTTREHTYTHNQTQTHTETHNTLQKNREKLSDHIQSTQEHTHWDTKTTEWDKAFSGILHFSQVSFGEVFCTFRKVNGKHKHRENSTT